MKSFSLRGYGRILWREATEQYTFCIGIFAMLVLMQTSLTTMATFNMFRPPTVAFGFSMALFMTAIYAAASSALLFSAEVDAGTFAFQRTKPIGWFTYLSGKLSWTVLSSIVLGLAAWIETSIWLGEFPTPLDASLALGVGGVGIAEGIAGGLIATIAVRGPLRAVITGIAMGSLVAWITVVVHHGSTGGGPTLVSTAYHEAAWARLIVAAVALAVGVTLAKVWYRTGQPVGRRLLSRLLQRETDAAPSPARWSSFDQPRRGRWFRLLWQAWRQVRSPAVIYWACCLAILIWAGLSYRTQMDRIRPLDRYALECMAWAAVGIFILSSLPAGYTFGADQRARFLQLARDGVSPREIWRSRVAVMAAILLIPAIVVLGLLWHPFGQPLDPPLKPLVVLLVALGYASALIIGQACSMFTRSRIIALLAAPVLVGCFAFWTGLTIFWAGLDWKLGALPLLLALLIGTRLLAGTRLRQDNSWRAMRVPMLLVAIAVVFSYQALALRRVHEIRPYDSAGGNDEMLNPFRRDRIFINAKAFAKQSRLETSPRKWIEDALTTPVDDTSSQDGDFFAMPWKENMLAVFGRSGVYSVASYSTMLGREVNLNRMLRDVIAQLDTPNDRLRDCIGFLEDWPEKRTPHAGWLVAAYLSDQIWLQQGPVDEQYATYGFHDEPLPSRYRWFSFERKRMLRLLDRVYRIAAERTDEYERAVINDQIGLRPVGYSLVSDLDIIPFEPDRPFWYQTSNDMQVTLARHQGFRLLDSVALVNWSDYTPFYNAEADRRGTILYLALRMYYNDHGGLPESLDVLVEEKRLDRLPVVPVTCKPFYYAPAGADDELLAAIKSVSDSPTRPDWWPQLDAPSLRELDEAKPFLWYPFQSNYEMGPDAVPGSFIVLDFVEQQE